MILKELFAQHNIKMTEKGQAAFNKAVVQYYPNLINMYVNHTNDPWAYYWSKISSIDLPEKDCIELMQLTAKYVKFWIYS